jgi:glycosyltransferase involved in cell wall biosynthesis
LEKHDLPRTQKLMLEQITPLILTYNEAPNIGRNLEKLRWAKDIIVIDSFSDDETVGIVLKFPQARVASREFDNFAGQCNFGLSSADIKTDWVLSLDADYILTDEFVDELRSLEVTKDVAAFRARFIYCINDRRLRSGVYPPVVVLFRREAATYRQDGHAHRVVIDGEIRALQSPILHDDRKPLSRWFQSQQHYTTLEAQKLQTVAAENLSWNDRIRQLRIVAPVAMLFYCLIIRGGILDGWAGFYYAFQRMIAEAMLSVRLLEHTTGPTEDLTTELSGRNNLEEVGTAQLRAKG